MSKEPNSVLLHHLRQKEISRRVPTTVYTHRGNATMEEKLDKPRLTVKEAAEEFLIPEATVRDWIFRKKIAVVKIGEKIIQIPRSEIHRLIKAIPAKE